MADYLFATEDWREQEEKFYLKFGFILQLVDDLQDIEEDEKAGSHTLMTNAAKEKRLEEQVNRISILPASAAGSAGGGSRKVFFPEGYLKALEPYLPVSIEFIKRMKIQKKRNGMPNSMVML